MSVSSGHTAFTRTVRSAGGLDRMRASCGHRTWGSRSGSIVSEARPHFLRYDARQGIRESRQWTTAGNGAGVLRTTPIMSANEHFRIFCSAAVGLLLLSGFANAMTLARASSELFSSRTSAARDRVGRENMIERDAELGHPPPVPRTIVRCANV